MWLHWLVSLSVLFVTIAGNSAENETINQLFSKLRQNKEENVSIAFLGDISYDNVVRYHVHQGNCTYNDSFKEIKPVLKDVDFVIANLESPVRNSKKEPWENSGVDREFEKIVIYAEDEALTSLKYLGVDAVSLANNHALDFGPDGITRTKKLLKRLKIKSAGYVRGYGTKNRQTPVIFTLKGIKFAFMGYCNHDMDCIVRRKKAFAGPAVCTVENVRKDILDLKKRKVDVIIFYAHWMDEYEVMMYDKEQQLVQLLLDHNVTIIMGSHPHVTTRHHFDGKRIVVPSVGNFLFAAHYSNFGEFSEYDPKPMKNSSSDEFFKRTRKMKNASQDGKIVKAIVSKSGGVIGAEYMPYRIGISDKHCLTVYPESKHWKTICSEGDRECGGEVYTYLIN